MTCGPDPERKIQFWSHCTCGGASKVRNRNVVQEAKHGEVSCPDLEERNDCNTVKVDCNVGTWGPWEERSVTCGGGIRMRCRDVTQETKHGGVPCPNPNYTGWFF